MILLGLPDWAGLSSTHLSFITLPVLRSFSRLETFSRATQLSGKTELGQLSGQRWRAVPGPRSYFPLHGGGGWGGSRKTQHLSVPVDRQMNETLHQAVCRRTRLARISLPLQPHLEPQSCGSPRRSLTDCADSFKGPGASWTTDFRSIVTSQVEASPSILCQGCVSSFLSYKLRKRFWFIEVFYYECFSIL